MGVWEGGTSVEYGESDRVVSSLDMRTMDRGSACVHTRLGCSSCVACGEVGRVLIVFRKWGEMTEKSIAPTRLGNINKKMRGVQGAASALLVPVQWTTEELKRVHRFVFHAEMLF